MIRRCLLVTDNDILWRKEEDFRKGWRTERRVGVCSNPFILFSSDPLTGDKEEEKEEDKTREGGEE